MSYYINQLIYWSQDHYKESTAIIFILQLREQTQECLLTLKISKESDTTEGHSL